MPLLNGPGMGYHYGPCKGNGKKSSGIVVLMIFAILGIIVVWIRANAKAIDYTVSEILIATFITIGTISFISFSAMAYLIIQSIRKKPTHQMQSHYACTCVECIPVSPGKVIVGGIETDTDTTQLAIESSNEPITKEYIDAMIRKWQKQNRD